MTRNPFRRLLWALGFKPYLFRCPKGRHDWRMVYGDEIFQLPKGRRQICRSCSRTK